MTLPVGRAGHDGNSPDGPPGRPALAGGYGGNGFSARPGTRGANGHVGNGPRRRVLLTVLVYNGRSFVPRALASIARLRSTSAHDVDVLVLDDASPEAGWGDELASLCASLGIDCYRTPRNLGIPRNMSLALLRGESDGYDHTVILNSDLVVPSNMVDAMVEAAEWGQGGEGADRRPTASVTAWSNNVSIFSLPNDDAERHLADEPTLDWVSAVLGEEFGNEPMVIPTGVGCCMLIPRAAIEAIGIFDPVFGRGYCEEVDWCRRAVDRGWQNVLATSTLVYHIGSATTRHAGLLLPGEQTVHVHEDIVDHRHPNYRGEVAQWKATGAIEAAITRAQRAIVRKAAIERGYVLEASWLHRTADPEMHPSEHVRFVVEPDGERPLVEAVTQGFRSALPVDGTGVLDAVAAFVGCSALQVRILDRGSQAAELSAAASASSIPLRNLSRYPERV